MGSGDLGYFYLSGLSSDTERPANQTITILTLQRVHILDCIQKPDVFTEWHHAIMQVKQFTKAIARANELHVQRVIESVR